MAEVRTTEASRTEADSPTFETWRRLVERAGGDLSVLTGRSAEGLPIAPLYPRHPADPPQPWRSRDVWSVAQRVDHPEAEAANNLALLDLEGGADALVLVDAASPFSRGFGRDARDLDLTLAGVELDFIGVRLDAGPATLPLLTALADLAVARRLTSAALDVDVGFDPIGWQARLGRPIADDPAPILEQRERAGLSGTAYLADGRPYHDAGAGEAQELAAVLATGVAYLRAQEALGLTLDAARKTIAVLLAADADVPLGLAKFRAMRRLWARVEGACGLTPKPLRLHAETSWRMTTRRDPWTNVMRATAAAFAAGLGGADRITVLPFTLPLGLPDEDARRLARNVQRVLIDEANLGRIADPAAGAGGFEALTEGLCETAWAQFQAIEREGGMVRALVDGGLRARIATTAARRANDIATLAQGIVGTSAFPSLDAPVPDVFDVAPREATAPGPDALPVLRDAAPFEALRDRADALATAGARPRVFLATLGPPAAFGPSATAAATFFAAGGLTSDPGREWRHAHARLDAFAASGTPIACLCGSDAAYADLAQLVEDLRVAGARRVYLVGAADRREAGIDAIIHEGCDALRILGDALESSSRIAAVVTAPRRGR